MLIRKELQSYSIVQDDNNSSIRLWYLGSQWGDCRIYCSNQDTLANARDAVNNYGATSINQVCSEHTGMDVM